jgi:hypothetical protein
LLGSQQRAAQRKLFLAHPIGQESEVPDTNKAGRQHVEEKTPNELHQRPTTLASAHQQRLSEGHSAVRGGIEHELPQIRLLPARID